MLLGGHTIVGHTGLVVRGGMCSWSAGQVKWSLLQDEDEGGGQIWVLSLVALWWIKKTWEMVTNQS